MKEFEMSPTDKHKSMNGEASQGNYLVNAKERNSERKQRVSELSQNRIGYHPYPVSTSKAERVTGSSYLRT